jgi:hypothetical protein
VIDDPGKVLIFNGACVLLVGLLCGAPLGRSINQGREDSTIRGWRVAHSGLVMGGIMLLVIALLIPNLSLNTPLVNALVWAFVVSAYGFVIALPLGAWTRHRGLKSTPPGVNIIVYAGNLTGACGSLIGTVILVYGSWRSI